MMIVIASCLSAFGTLRRSKICGLIAEDVFNNTLHIRRSCAKDKNNKFIIKQFPKNYTSARDAVMPGFVIAMLPTQGHSKSKSKSNHTAPYTDFRAPQHTEISLSRSETLRRQYYACPWDSGPVHHGTWRMGV